MSRKFHLQILLPISGYEDGIVYDSDNISLSRMNYRPVIDNVYYRRIKEKSSYASFSDIVMYASKKYSLGEISGYSMYSKYDGGSVIDYQNQKYIIEADEVAKLV